MSERVDPIGLLLKDDVEWNEYRRYGYRFGTMANVRVSLIGPPAKSLTSGGPSQMGWNAAAVMAHQFAQGGRLFQSRLDNHGEDQ